jgi:hypothetical protein
MNSSTQTTRMEAVRDTNFSAIAVITSDTAGDASIDGCSRTFTTNHAANPIANNAASSPSLCLGVSSIHRGSRSSISHPNAAAYGESALRHLLHVLSCAIILAIIGIFAASCGDAPKPAETKSDAATASDAPAKPVVPDDIQAGAQSLLGTETTVLLNGDLAKNGKQQFLAANVVPKTSKNNNIPGTIITRAVIAQNEDGQWKEIFRCDEHLKNAKGFLGGTPMSDVAGWRIAFEQDPAKGLSLYLTPLKGVDDPAHSLPIGVRYNPQTKRYQTLDRTYEHFLLEQPTITGTPKSVLH